jgi:hypothetical protein
LIFVDGDLTGAAIRGNWAGAATIGRIVSEMGMVAGAVAGTGNEVGTTASSLGL